LIDFPWREELARSQKAFCGRSGRSSESRSLLRDRAAVGFDHRHGERRSRDVACSARWQSCRRSCNRSPAGLYPAGAVGQRHRLRLGRIVPRRRSPGIRPWRPWSRPRGRSSPVRVSCACECLPKRLEGGLAGHEARTAPEMGSASKRNGELLAPGWAASTFCSPLSAICRTNRMLQRSTSQLLCSSHGATGSRTRRTADPRGPAQRSTSCRHEDRRMMALTDLSVGPTIDDVTTVRGDERRRVVLGTRRECLHREVDVRRRSVRRRFCRAAMARTCARKSRMMSVKIAARSTPRLPLGVVAA
jgi:hypothetical protein